MATLDSYPSLSNQDVLSNQSFWQAEGTLKAGSFCGRILQITKDDFIISYNHKSYDIQVSGIYQAGGIDAGDVIKVTFASAIKTGTKINLTDARLEVLVKSSAESIRSKMDVDISKKWNGFVNLLREFFLKNNFTELRTPTLVESPGIEEHIDVFKTTFSRGSAHKAMYLPTSPEFHLKKALSMGWNQVFELKDCFRNNEDSPMHQPEFIMLEWYRAYSNLDFVKEDTKNLIAFLSSHLGIKSARVEEKTIADLFMEYLDFNLTTDTTKDQLIALLERVSISHAANDTWDDLYFRVFVEKIEPHLGKNAPLIVTKYPPSQAALARLTSDGWADRFELYWYGTELANAFHELNDPVEQKKRFELTNQKRQKAEREVLPEDKDFMQALEYGLPPSAGIAMGIERLFMCFYEIKDIRELRSFSL